MQLSTSSASRDSQAGFALMEAVIAAAVLMIVILGVLKGLDTANRSSGREKARAVAAALTEQDQERLRSFRAVDLSNYEETRSVDVNNVSYTIDSKAEWVRDSTGGTESCNNSTTQADYMRVVTTTSSGLVATPIAPITMASLVAAPIGAFGTNQGTLGVQVNDRDGAGVPGMPVTITGPATVTNETNSVGCAIFAYVPVGNYTARLNEAGWVDQGGATLSTKGATVTDGDVSRHDDDLRPRGERAGQLRHRHRSRRPRLGQGAGRVRLELLRAGRAAVLGSRPAAVGSRRDHPSDLDRRHGDVPVQ